MEKIHNTRSVIVDSLRRIAKFWPLPFGLAILKTALVVVSVLGGESVILLATYLYDRFWLGEDVLFIDYYPTHFFVGLAFVGAVIFFYMMLHEAAQSNRKVEVKASKYQWDDVLVKDRLFPSKSNFAYGIKITNIKPFDLRDLYVQLIHLEVNGEKLSIRSDASARHPLIAWIDSDGYTLQYHDKVLGKDGQEISFVLADKTSDT